MSPFAAITVVRTPMCSGTTRCRSAESESARNRSGGIKKEFRRGAYPCVNRGGRGHEVVKRAELARVLPAPIELVDWDAVEAGGNGKPKGESRGERNGSGTLFE